jgi:hypothetical protein
MKSTLIVNYCKVKEFLLDYDTEMGKILEVLVLEYDFAGTRTRTRTREVSTHTRTRPSLVR